MAPSVQTIVPEVELNSTADTPPGGPGGPCTITSDVAMIFPTAVCTIHSYFPASAYVILCITKYPSNLPRRNLL